MSILITGIVVWSAAHLFPAVLPGLRSELSRKLGDGPYRGLFSLVIVAALALIVFGWKSAVPGAVYAPPLATGIVASSLILIGLVLFFASLTPGNIKRYIRHPQMTGVVLWGVAHLLSNGDSRSITLFGGLTIWAVLEIVFINRREGPREKPARAAIMFDAIPVAVGVIAFAAVLYFHAWLFGVSVIPG